MFLCVSSQRARSEKDKILDPWLPLTPRNNGETAFFRKVRSLGHGGAGYIEL
jgi:hypothetical protein